MKFYTQSHKHYCGIDLHARTMYICILDAEGQVVLHKELKAGPDAINKAIQPYLKDLVTCSPGTG